MIMSRMEEFILIVKFFQLYSFEGAEGALRE